MVTMIFGLVILQALLVLLAHYIFLVILVGALVLIGRVVWIYSPPPVSHGAAAVLTPSGFTAGLNDIWRSEQRPNLPVERILTYIGRRE